MKSNPTWQAFLDKIFPDKATQLKIQAIFGQDISLIKFLQHCELRPDGRGSLSELYSVYCARFAPASGMLSLKSFHRAMETLFNTKRVKGCIWYAGLSLPPSKARRHEITLTFNDKGLMKPVREVAANIKKAVVCLASCKDKAAVLSANKLLKLNAELLRKMLVNGLKKGVSRRV